MNGPNPCSGRPSPAAQGLSGGGVLRGCSIDKDASTKNHTLIARRRVDCLSLSLALSESLALCLDQALSLSLAFPKLRAHQQSHCVTYHFAGTETNLVGQSLVVGTGPGPVPVYSGHMHMIFCGHAARRRAPPTRATIRRARTTSTT